MNGSHQCLWSNLEVECAEVMILSSSEQSGPLLPCYGDVKAQDGISVDFKGVGELLGLTNIDTLSVMSLIFGIINSYSASRDN